MTDRTFIIGVVIANVPLTVTAVAGLVTVLRGQKQTNKNITDGQKETAQHISDVREVVINVKEEINGRMSQLLKAENAQGRQDERDAQK
jgi:hypothetical protein